MHLQSQPSFFNTCAEQADQYTKFLQKKQELGDYVSKLDLHIHKAKSFQDRAIGRKKANLLSTLEKMRDQVHKQSQRSRKMEEFFYLHCEKILRDDIGRWEDNREFFNSMFEMYDHKLKQKRAENDTLRTKIAHKTKHLKQMMKQNRTRMTTAHLGEKLETAYKQKSVRQTLPTEQSSTCITRVKTEVSLPSLSRPDRMHTQADQEHSGQESYRNYMKPIRTTKSVANPQAGMSLLQMLNWYRKDRQAQENWFEKLVFVDRNFKKVVEAIMADS